MEYKSKKKKKKCEANFLGNYTAFDIEKGKVLYNCEKYDNYCLDPEPGPQSPEPKLFQSQNQNQNRTRKSLRLHNTDFKATNNLASYPLYVGGGSLFVSKNIFSLWFNKVQPNFVLILDLQQIIKIRNV